MHLVWIQCDLFDHKTLPNEGSVAFTTRQMNDAERDRRSCQQWLRSILSYLEFRSGASWRRLSDPEQRWNPERLDYLVAIRKVQSIIAGQSLSLELLNKKTDDVRVGRLAVMGRDWLVTELLRANPSLTDRKILFRLRCVKLARMLVEARDRAAQPLQRTA